MTLTTAAISARLRSTPQKYKLFLTLIQINRFFYRKTSLPHHTSAITFRISLNPHFHNSCEARLQPSDIFRISVNPWILDSVASARLHPLRPHLPRIHRLPICLHPVQHIMILNSVTRWIPVVILNKINHLIISCQPTFILRHPSPSSFFTSG